MDKAPSRNPNEGPKTRALKMSTNHIGSMPTAPVPSGRSAAIRAERTANKATDFASKFPLLTPIMKIARAIGVARINNHCGRLMESETKNGQMKPHALMALAKMRTTRLDPENVKMFFVFTVDYLKPQ
jgi:hypothetical protein